MQHDFYRPAHMARYRASIDREGRILAVHGRTAGQSLLGYKGMRPDPKMPDFSSAFGIIPVDGPFADFNDKLGADVSNRRARSLGYQAKWAIHPALIDGINATFLPTAEDVTWALTVRKALHEARASGTGSAQLDGRLIEAATMKTVDRILMLVDRS